MIVIEIDFLKSLTANIYVITFSIGRLLSALCKQHRADWNWQFTQSKLRKQEKVQSKMARMLKGMSWLFLWRES